MGNPGAHLAGERRRRPGNVAGHFFALWQDTRADQQCYFVGFRSRGAASFAAALGCSSSWRAALGLQVSIPATIVAGAFQRAAGLAATAPFLPAALATATACCTTTWRTAVGLVVPWLAAVVTQSLGLAPSSLNSFASSFGLSAISCHVTVLTTIVPLHAALAGLPSSFSFA